MGLFNQSQPQAPEETPAAEVPATDPVVEAPVEQPQEEAPVETQEQPVQENEVPSEEPQAPVVDRSAYNCTQCGGEGYIGSVTDITGKICSACAGTGKV